MHVLTYGLLLIYEGSGSQFIYYGIINLLVAHQ